MQFERIHPFQDGNGRTGRVIMFKECLKNHIFPFIIEDELKAEYYESLRKVQENDYDSLIDFCKREQEKYEKQRERVRELFKKNRIEEERNMIKAGKIR